MITNEELKLMEQIEQLEPKVYINLSSLTDDDQARQYIKDRDELSRLRRELGAVSDFKYTRVGFGPGSLWIQTGNQTVYQAVHSCDECGTSVMTFLSERERDQYITAEKLNGSHIWYDEHEAEIKQIVRKTP
jgi:hypothetical protein